LNNLVAGNYTVIVTDINGCTATTIATVLQPTQLTATSTQNSVSCFGGTNGSFTVTANGGTPSYSYNIGSGVQASPIFTNLGAGNYTITVTDLNGCTATTSVTVLQPTQLTATSVQDSVNCFGGNDGSTTITASGGIPTYTYNIGSGAQASPVLTNLVAGNYTITVTDLNGCTVITSMTVLQPALLTASSVQDSVNCFGGNDGSITVTSNGGTPGYSYNIGSGAQASPVLTNLVAGNYTITVTDINGCTATTSVTVLQPTQLTATSVQDSVNCFGGTNGSITVTASGGTPSYSYNLGNGAQASPVLTNLVAGNYTITVTDLNGCTATNSVTVLQPTLLTATSVQDSVNCFGGNDGSITVTTNGGTPSFSYNLGNGAQASPVLTSLVAGNYTITVTDLNGCTATTSVTVLQPTQLTATSVQDSVNCFGGSDGSITITTTGGTPGYSYNIGSGAQASPVMTNLVAGNYTITVTDINGCTATTSVTVLQPTLLTATSVQDSVNCFGGNDGSITVTTNGGTPSYSYNLGSGAQASPIFPNLTVGNYTIIVTDLNGCTATTSVTVLQPTLLTATSVQDSVNCFGGTNGSITVTASGGTPSYSYNLGNGAQASPVLTNLVAGNYTITVTDLNGCTATTSATVLQPTQLTATSVQDSVNCFGGSDGSITVTANGGTPSYSYNLGSGAQASPVLTSLVAGNYTITVTDINGCTATTSVTVLQPTQLTATSVQDSVNCFGGNDGSITVTASGGMPSYSYNLGNGAQASPVLTNLVAGNYTITVTDLNGCTASTTVTVLQPTQLSATSVQDSVNCFGGTNGSITVTANGGTPGYSYNIGSGAQASPVLTNLVAGNYTITVTDLNGCTATTSVTVLQPTLLTATSVQDSVNCFGGNDGSITVTTNGGTPSYSYNLGSGAQASPIFPNLTVGNYTIIVTDLNGCTATTSVTVLQPTLLTATSVQDSVNCFGGSDGSITVTTNGGTPGYSYNIGNGAQASPILTNLSAGNYTITVTDLNGCTATTSVTVLQPTPLTASSVQDSVNCFGGTDGSITVTTNGGTPGYSYNLGNGIQASPIFTNLASGNYTITVTDLNGCTASTIVTVLQPTQLSATSVQDSVNCFGGTNGSITVTANGGTPGYSYNIGSGAQASPVLTNLVAGNYTITVTDINGCTATTSVTVLQPTQLTATSVQDSVNCFGGTNGSITVTASGGTPSYSYNLGNGAQASPVLTNLVAGNYTITVTDLNGCTATTSVTVLQPTLLTATSVQDSVNCFGSNDGSITVTTSGGTPSYSYNLGNGAQVSATLNNLVAGNYTITVTDLNGCTATTSVTVLQPTPLTASSVQDSVNCFGGTDGSITVTTNGGTPGYSYNLGNGIQASPIFTNLASGNYTITVTDFNGCTATTSVTVLQPTQLTASSAQDSVNCFGGNDGSTTIIASGGIPTYTYNIGGGAQASPTFTGLVAGTYTVIITDLQGCTATLSLSIFQPQQLVAIATAQAALCNGSATGSITVNTSNSTAPFAYNIGSGFQSSNIFTGLNAGTYTITVSDGNACTTSVSASITEPTPLNMVLGSTNVTCNGGSNGIISVAATGGTAPYSYTIGSGIQTSNQFTGLIAGTYTITVTDANGCTISQSVTIQEPAPLSASLVTSNASCYGQADGAAQINLVTGGTAPYQISWSNTAVGNLTTNLSAGAYTVSIVDANNCLLELPFNILSPAPIQIFTSALSNVTCSGAGNGFISVNPQGGQAPYVYNWSNGASTAAAQQLIPGLYFVTVTDAQGCSASNAIGFAISEPTPLSLNVFVVDTVTCFGYTDAALEAVATGSTAPYSFSWSNAVNTAINLNLSVGTYTVTVTDAQNCTAVASATLTQPVPLQASFELTNPICSYDFGSISILVDSTSGPAPYIYSTDGGLLFGSGNVALGLSGGTYNIVVQDLNGCSFTTQATVTTPAPIQVNITPASSVMELGTSVELTVNTVSQGSLQYLWTPSTGLSCNDCNNPVANPTETSTYSLLVTDADGCTATATAVVQVDPVRNVYIPTAFTPNGDGNNDMFTVFASNGVVRVERLIIADRWGNIVFDRSEFAPNDPTLGWDGTYKGLMLNASTLVYYVEVLFEDGKILPYKGDVNLIR
jgi:gliding motility-associated-like protein